MVKSNMNQAILSKTSTASRFMPSGKKTRQRQSSTTSKMSRRTKTTTSMMLLQSTTARKTTPSRQPSKLHHNYRILVQPKLPFWSLRASVFRVARPIGSWAGANSKNFKNPFAGINKTLAGNTNPNSNASLQYRSQRVRAACAESCRAARSAAQLRPGNIK